MHRSAESPFQTARRVYDEAMLLFCARFCGDSEPAGPVPNVQLPARRAFGCLAPTATSSSPAASGLYPRCCWSPRCITDHLGRRRCDALKRQDVLPFGSACGPSLPAPSGLPPATKLPPVSDVPGCRPTRQSLPDPWFAQHQGLKWSGMSVMNIAVDCNRTVSCPAYDVTQSGLVGSNDGTCNTFLS